VHKLIFTFTVKTTWSKTDQKHLDVFNFVASFNISAAFKGRDKFFNFFSTSKCFIFLSKNFNLL
jgi:hypothetical protein